MSAVEVITQTTSGSLKRSNAIADQRGNKKRKRRRKKKKKRSENLPPLLPIKKESIENEDVEIEYVAMDVNDDPQFAQFKDIFAKFTTPEELCLSKEERLQREKELYAAEMQAEQTEDTDTNEVKTEEPPKMSKRERKKKNRLSVAALKQYVPRPELVEAWDVTAADPAILVYLKSYRNAVPVPRHWAQKRKYLQGKRGIEKAPFELPEFIAATGISRIRQAIMDAEEQKKAKQKQRQKMQPKLGRMDIDYQILHDAFFKYQTKPKLSKHGDLYYEGKEYEVRLKEKKPGHLSDELKAALGMPIIAKEGMPPVPPPWLINMQRYGPPPSYQNLKIPGLNAPIPPGGQFGYHPGGWGKPPVDQFGKPLYGDVFGNAAPEMPPDVTQPIEKKHWGALEEEEEEEEESSEEEGSSEEEEEENMEGIETPLHIKSGIESGLVTPTGLETPDIIDLRKKIDKKDKEEQPPQQLYRVLDTEQVGSVGSAAFGSAFEYVGLGKGKEKEEEEEESAEDEEKRKKEAEALAEVYNDRLKTAKKEDVAEAIAKQNAKKKKEDEKKVYKDFKF